MRGSFVKQQKWTSGVCQYHLSVCIAETLDIAFKFLSQRFLLFSNKQFKNIGLSVAFGSENKLSMLAFSLEKKNKTNQSCNKSETDPVPPKKVSS